MRPFVNPSVRVAAPGDAPKHHVQTRTMLQLNHGTMLHLNHGGGRAPAVYCDDVERIARRQGATREEEHFPQMSLGTVARRPLRAPKYRPTTRSEP